MKHPKTLRIVYASRGRTILTIDLDRDAKRAPVRSQGDDGISVSLGVSQSARAYDVGKKLSDTLVAALLDLYPDDKWRIAEMGKTAQFYGSNVVDGHAPDCTFDVRAGILYPMNRLATDQDNDTLTFSAAYVEHGAAA